MFPTKSNRSAKCISLNTHVRNQRVRRMFICSTLDYSDEMHVVTIGAMGKASLVQTRLQLYPMLI